LTGADFKRKGLNLRVGFLIQKKLQISLPGLKKRVVCLQPLREKPRGFEAKKKVH